MSHASRVRRPAAEAQQEKAVADHMSSLSAKQAAELHSQSEQVERLLAARRAEHQGCVDRETVAGLLCSYFDQAARTHQLQVLGVLASLLGLDTDERVQIGLVSRWQVPPASRRRPQRYRGRH